MIIRQQQMDDLGEAMRQRFEEQMLRHLRANFRSHIGGWPDDRVRRLIRYGIDESATHGVQAEQDVARYIEYLVIYGTEFHGLGWSAQILATPDLDGAAKMDRIDNYDLFNR